MVQQQTFCDKRTSGSTGSLPLNLSCFFKPLKSQASITCVHRQGSAGHKSNHWWSFHMEVHTIILISENGSDCGMAWGYIFNSGEYAVAKSDFENQAICRHSPVSLSSSGLGCAQAEIGIHSADLKGAKAGCCSSFWLWKVFCLKVTKPNILCTSVATRSLSDPGEDALLIPPSWLILKWHLVLTWSRGRLWEAQLRKIKNVKGSSHHQAGYLPLCSAIDISRSTSEELTTFLSVPHRRRVLLLGGRACLLTDIRWPSVKIVQANSLIVPAPQDIATPWNQPADLWKGALFCFFQTVIQCQNNLNTTCWGSLATVRFSAKCRQGPVRCPDREGECPGLWSSETGNGSKGF